ncbi:MAG: CoA pyrophosphatase [Burkholderiaceae bacterium]|nr:CoA pyrophosphatase [Burkholderiaceae bacterium]
MSDLAADPLPRAPRRPLFDPETIPLDPAFADPAVRGAAVEPERLTAAALRTRFARPPAWQPEITTDGRLYNLEAPPRPAAVLVPLVVREEGVSVLLTQRTAHLHDHAGQISFPGGRVEEEDPTPVATALRESFEEIGLAPDSVDVVGTLPQYVTATSYLVTPVVGLIEREFSLALDDFEVAEAFEVPLAFLMDPANHERRRFEHGALSRTFYAMPYTAARRYFIWGATAAMLRNFYHFLRA